MTKRLLFAVLMLFCCASVKAQYKLFPDCYNMRVKEIACTKVFADQGREMTSYSLRFAMTPHTYSPLQLYTFTLSFGTMDDYIYGSYWNFGLGYDPRYYILMTRLELFVGVDWRLLARCSEKDKSGRTIYRKEHDEIEVDGVTMPYIGANFFVSDNIALTAKLGKVYWDAPRANFHGNEYSKQIIEGTAVSLGISFWGILWRK